MSNQTENKNQTPKPKKEKKQPFATTAFNTVPLNQLSLIVKNSQGHDLINEKGCTFVGVLMQEDGKILTSFLGDYNKEILKTLRKVNYHYFKSLQKKLFMKEKPAKQPKQNQPKQNQPKQETKNTNATTKNQQKTKSTKNK